ncbi:MagZ family protein [Erysipelothrix piscisicarius]|uniref:MagZ family protein n=2 Tax=Erysipelothrix piscisicarius TaxID=2485784 RepID=A0A3S8RP41_9FIRM|nr:MagZ family protein [Erysipelothrix piscisicarius]
MMNSHVNKRIQAMREHFGWDKTDTIEFMPACVVKEALELQESLNDEANFKKEIADVLMYTISICLDRDYDIELLINDKIDEVMKREY